jgi:hypothetical protein
MLEYLITGTGRCGTGYAARLLSSVGVPCGHEAIFRLDGLEKAVARVEQFDLAAESSWLAAPWLKLLPDQVRVAHLVRHPQHVIDSLLRMQFFDLSIPEYRPYTRFVYAHLPGLSDEPTPLAKAVSFYIRWNRLIEAGTGDRAVRVRIEDCPGALLDALRIDPGGNQPFDVFDDRQYNSRGGLDQTWNLDMLPDDLLGELADLAGEYGYALDTPPERPARQPQVYWAYLLIPAMLEAAVSSIVNVAMVCGREKYTRLMVPYMRVDRARNLLIDKFLEDSNHPNDVLVFLDCDHEHPPDVVRALVRHSSEMGVVGALAFRRSPPHDPLFFAISDDGRLLRMDQWQAGSIYRCDAVGSGAIAIRRWVFDRLIEQGFTRPFFRYEYPAWSNYDQSEDVYFARSCHAAGIHHYCDTSVEIPHLIHAVADSARWKNQLTVGG